MKVKGRHPRGSPRSRWEQQVRKGVMQKEERICEEIEEEGCGRTELTDGEIWLSDDPPKMEKSIRRRRR
jgi:hypothetical protein